MGRSVSYLGLAFHIVPLLLALLTMHVTKHRHETTSSCVFVNLAICVFVYMSMCVFMYVCICVCVCVCVCVRVCVF